MENTVVWKYSCTKNGSKGSLQGGLLSHWLESGQQYGETSCEHGCFTAPRFSVLPCCVEFLHVLPMYGFSPDAAASTFLKHIEVSKFPYVLMGVCMCPRHWLATTQVWLPPTPPKTCMWGSWKKMCECLCVYPWWWMATSPVSLPSAFQKGSWLVKWRLSSLRAIRKAQGLKKNIVKYKYMKCVLDICNNEMSCVCSVVTWRTAAHFL